jgi:hypothetical protein
VLLSDVSYGAASVRAIVKRSVGLDLDVESS